MRRPARPLDPPLPLVPGGTIAVLAISSPSKRDRIEAGARALERKGYRVRIAPNVDSVERRYLAGSDAARLAALNEALRDRSVDAIAFARGGYGAMRILEGVDYQALRDHPRPVIGYSDLTALHQAIAVETGIVPFHGPMLNLDFHDGLSPGSEVWFSAMLAGQAPLTHAFDPRQVLAHGRAEGILFGGCLSLTSALLDTRWDYWLDGGIWFWEDVDEPVYRIDRMLTTLRLSGRFRSIQGVMIGRLKDCGEESELGILLSEFFSDLGIPVVRDLPFGHHGDNLLLPIGRPVRLDTAAATIEFPEPAVRTGARS
ncbi:MAG TPA: LD-carboxypeptidase [Thermoanaerobaculia bacterium]|nr:LD-carboxypeptidase [Thermoanaerobaculia bacterium]